MVRGVIVSRHAIARYRERVRDMPDTDIIAALSGPAFVKAADFGAPYVKLGTGQHVVVTGRRIATVLAKDTWLATLSTTSIFNLKYARS